MATNWTLGGDALDPIKLAEFWAAALGYVPEPGFYDDDCASLIDPDGVGYLDQLGHVVMLDPEGNEFCVG